MWCEEGVQLHSAVGRYLVFLSPLAEKIILSPLNGLGTPMEEQLAINVQVYFCTLNSIPLFYMSVLFLVSHCFGNCSFVLSFENGKCDSSNFFLFFIIILVESLLYARCYYKL